MSFGSRLREMLQPAPLRAPRSQAEELEDAVRLRLYGDRQRIELLRPGEPASEASVSNGSEHLNDRRPPPDGDGEHDERQSSAVAGVAP